MSIKLSNYFFLLAVIGLTLSFSVKAQNSSVCGKGYTYEYVSYLEYESAQEMQFNSVKDTSEPVIVSRNVMKWRWQCVPITSETKPTNKITSSNWNLKLTAGRYSGEWIARFYGADVKDHVGTWDITIGSNGKVTGSEFDKTIGKKGSINGFVDVNGFIKVTVIYSTEAEIAGVLEKNGNELSGKLKQPYIDGVYANIEIVLKRNMQNNTNVLK